MRTITLAELRRRLVSAQGYASRTRTAKRDEIVATISRLGCVQLDSISTVDRSHRIAIGSRIGAYAESTISHLLREGRIFEYWAHEACLLPIEDYPMHRWRMKQYEHAHPWRGDVLAREPELVERVLAEIRERGPLASRDFDGKGTGQWGWSWKPAKVALEALHSAGRLAIAGRSSFQRLYELPERVIPDELRDGPVPNDDEFTRWATLRGVIARGALTESAVAEMWRMRGGVARVRPHADALVREGLLERVAVDDGGASVLLPAGVEPGDAPGAVLLSPFDNLVWDRKWLQRVFGFEHVIEVYKREHERVYGYYVLPFLRGDKLVGRADLKADRDEGVLRVRAFHREPGVRASGALDDALDRALARLAHVIALERVER